MNLSTLLLSRIQFAFTIGFHIIFPTLNIGLAVFIAWMEALWLKTRNPSYLKTAQFLTKIFALTFGMGVVSGIVMSYELGTNFGNFTNVAGNVVGPLFGYEVLTAFFLEAGFLGVMLFGWKRVSPKLHFLATSLVAVGTIISAFWIMSANSWMQTPAGYHIVNGNYVVSNWVQVIFNPSFLRRFFHMVLASLISSLFVIAGIASWYLLRQRHEDIAKPCLRFALMAALVLTPIQIVVGDLVGLKMHEFQPLKIAAIEGNWNTMQGAPLYLFAIPDETEALNRDVISIPYGASLFNTHSLHGTLIGLKSVPPTDWPSVFPVFFGFRIMVGIGLLFFFMALYGVLLQRRDKLFTSRGFQHFCVWTSPLGFIATLAGWITAESGRQPWTIYNLLRTQDAASGVPAHSVLITLVMFIAIYGLIFGFYLYYLFKFIHSGPVNLDEAATTIGYLPHPKDERLQ
ncbi:MAG: cytochrome ubiquinol oxidase subunit I [Gammaproteobacteria bacterium]